MMSVNIHGFLKYDEQGKGMLMGIQAGAIERSLSGCDQRVVVVEFPKPAADLSCGWLVDQAQEKFRALGATTGHVVGLKEFGNKNDQEAKVKRFSAAYASRAVVGFVADGVQEAPYMFKTQRRP